MRAMVARVWGTAIGQEIGKPLPDCSRCRRPESANQRIGWGCDAPSLDALDEPRTVFTTGCSRCFGSDEDCPDCEDGVISYSRCPSAVIDESEDVIHRAANRALRAYVQYDQRGVLPGPGGYVNQTPQFATVVDVIDHERGRWEKAQAEHRKVKRGK